jgi:hypothetical protein
VHRLNLLQLPVWRRQQGVEEVEPTILLLDGCHEWALLDAECERGV